MKNFILTIDLLLLSVSAMAQGGNAVVTSGSGSPSGSCAFVQFFVQTTGTLWYCPSVWTAVSGGGGGGDTITSPNSTITVGGTSANTTLDVTGSAGKILAGATPALTSTPTLGASGTLGSLTFGNATSGTLTLQPAAGAITGTVLIPSGADTLGNLTGAQAFTNKDLTGAGNTFPTFNQNTTGSAAKWTTARNLAGNSVDGSANVAFANKFIVQGTVDAGLSAAQFLGALGTGILKNTTTTGILSIAVGSDLPTAIPIASVGSAGLSGTSPITIASTGVIACATCNVSAAVANPPLDKSGTGLSNPTADATFTYPAASTTGLTIAGTTPVSAASATGTTATTLFQVNGVAGGACTNAACTGGVGSSPTLNAGTGGSVAGASGNAVGGAGGNFTINGGVGANSINSGVNSNGGNITLNPGAAGTGGGGTAGKAGVVLVTGPGAGFVGFQQGSAVTVSNSQVPANTIIEQAPTSVTAYTLTKPAAAPTNNFSVKSISNAGVESFAKTQQTVMLTSQYTNSTTGFTNVTGTSSLAFALEANTTYQGTCTLYYQGAATAGLNIEFTGPASPTFVTYGLVDPGSATTLVQAAVATAYSTSLGAAVTTATTNFPATVTFGISNGANAGTLQMLAKSSAAAQLQIQTGSFCVMQ